MDASLISEQSLLKCPSPCMLYVRIDLLGLIGFIYHTFDLAANLSYSMNI